MQINSEYSSESFPVLNKSELYFYFIFPILIYAKNFPKLIEAREYNDDHFIYADGLVVGNKH